MNKSKEATKLAEKFKEVAKPPPKIKTSNLGLAIKEMLNDEQEQGNTSTFRRRSYLEDNEVSSKEERNENTLIDFLTKKMGSDQISRAQLQMVFDKIIREESDPARK